MRVAQKLLCAPTFGRGSARAVGCWWRESKESKTPPCHQECTKTAKKTGGLEHFLAYKWSKTPLFTQKYLTRYSPKTFFEEYINFKIFHYFRHHGATIPCSKFWKSYMP
jgi:hypothetical protein